MKSVIEYCDDFLFEYVVPICLIGFVLMCICTAIGGVWWAVSPESEEHRARRIAESTPHVYAEVDGCTVYTWYANSHNHYFTKCPTKVTTESKRSERSGKITKQFTETIETER
jgi:hypothetical protein